MKKFLLKQYDTYQMRMLVMRNRLILAVLIAIYYQILRSWYSTGRNIRKMLLNLKILKPTLWERMVEETRKQDLKSKTPAYIPRTERNSTWAEDHWGGGNIHK